MFACSAETLKHGGELQPLTPPLRSYYLQKYSAHSPLTMLACNAVATSEPAGDALSAAAVDAPSTPPPAQPLRSYFLQTYSGHTPLTRLACKAVATSEPTGDALSAAAVDAPLTHAHAPNSSTMWRQRSNSRAVNLNKKRRIQEFEFKCRRLCI